MSADIIRFAPKIDKRSELHEIRQGVRDSLKSFGVETEEGLELSEIGYVLGLKLRGQATTIEVYGRPDCVESLRDRLPRPDGSWALRQKQLGAAGLSVVSVGYNQWESLVSGHSSANRAQWLQQLLAASSWAGNLDSSSAANMLEDQGPQAARGEQKAGQKRRRHVATDKTLDGSVASVSPAGADPPGIDYEEDGDSCPVEQGAGGATQVAPSLWLDAGAREDALRQTKKRIKEGRVWTLHYSDKKQLWYYFNNVTKAKTWKPPSIEGWVVKASSGQHRPYIGLRCYYYHRESKKMQYEPPDSP